ncbi:hypothetical protein YC2023_115072 [Brassica napus]
MVNKRKKANHVIPMCVLASPRTISFRLVHEANMSIRPSKLFFREISEEACEPLRDDSMRTLKVCVKDLDYKILPQERFNK